MLGDHCCYDKFKRLLICMHILVNMKDQRLASEVKLGEKEFIEDSS